MDKIKPLVLGDLEIKVPIIQGGMGVRVSLAPLAAAVANCGAGGTIASVGISPDTEENKKDVVGSQRKYLVNEIREARKLSKGVIGVNIMVALTNYEDLVRAATKEEIDYIISGAGLPISLPEFAEGSSVKLVPLIASARGAALILKTWKRRYNRFPDGIVVEGPLSGGHIAGYSLDELISKKNTMQNEQLLESSVKDVLKLVQDVEKSNGVKIPVIAAGGVFDGKDLAKFFKIGASGVQIGTRFVATHECSVSNEFKELYIKAGKEDIDFIQSPVGMPAKVIRTKFTDKIMRGEGEPFKCIFRCLRTCDPEKVPYCIAKALINAAEGKMDKAVVLAGTNVAQVNKIVSVKELIDEIIAGAQNDTNAA